MSKLWPWMVLLAGLAACDDDDEDTDTDTTPPPTEEEARVRFVHLSPDAPLLDVFLGADTDPDVEDLAFEEGTGYVEILPGNRPLQLVPAGESRDQAIVELDLQLAPDTGYSVVAWGAANNLQTIFLEDDAAGLASGDTRLQFVHVAQGVEDVDILTIADNVETPAISDLAPGEYDSFDVAIGALTVGVDLDNDAASDLRFDLPDFQVEGLVNLYIATDADGTPFMLAHLPNGSTQRIDASEAPAGETQIRVLHLVEDVGPVDLWFDNETEPALTDVEFGEDMDYIDVPAGVHTVYITLADEPKTTAFAEVDLDLLADTMLSITAYGTEQDADVLMLEDDDTGLAPGDARLTLVHVATCVGEVDIYRIEDDCHDEIARNVGYGDWARVDVEPQDVNLGFDLDDDGELDVTFETLPLLEAGDMINIYAVCEDDQAFIMVQTDNGDVIRIDESMP